ncbi:hypothetical protein I553_9838 [Mycobacterium xenopi 4042]|uniref:Uncharacterized protein n=1 Tax=Mycobacterium xenopi 4042 TaxID=1299334 RepID=X7YPV0_MYCXE|nr:hypothetical protein I553_9838 [Mycobacterium xenopi 4042]
MALTHEGERVHDYLGNEADHFFVAAFLMLGLLTVVAVVASVLVWEWRPTAGRRWWSRCRSAWWAPQRPQPAGRAAGACALRRRRHRRSAADARAPGALLHRGAAGILRAGPLQIGCTLLLPAATTALVYAFLVAAAVRDDLGGYPAVESPQAPTAVTVSPGGGSR